MNELTTCPLCCGEPGLLGSLGKLVYLRCCNCGIEWSVEAEVIGIEDQDGQPVELFSNN